MARRFEIQYVEHIFHRGLGLQVSHMRLFRFPVRAGEAAGIAGDEDMFLPFHLAEFIGLEEPAF